MRDSSAELLIVYDHDTSSELPLMMGAVAENPRQVPFAMMVAAQLRIPGFFISREDGEYLRDLVATEEVFVWKEKEHCLSSNDL